MSNSFVHLLNLKSLIQYEKETNQKGKSPRKSLYCLWSSLHLAQKMGKSLGRREVLQRCLSKKKGATVANPNYRFTLRPKSRIKY